MRYNIKKIRQKIKDGTVREMVRETGWIYQYGKKYKWAIAYYILIGVLGIGLGLIGSLASKYLIDAVTGHDSSNIGIIIGIIIGMAVGGIVTDAVTNRISTKINLKVTNEIQSDIYSKIMLTEWESVSVFHSGDLLNRFNGDVDNVAGSVLGWFPSLITIALRFLATLAIILYYDPTMAFIALLSAPVTLLLSRILIGRMRGYNQQMRQISSEVVTFHEESFQKIKVIKSFDLIPLFLQKLIGMQRKYTVSMLDYNKFSIYTSSFLGLVGILVTYATYGWGVYRLWSGAITYGTMTLFLQLAGSLSGGFNALVGMVPSAISAATSAGRIMAIIDLPREEGKDLPTVNIIDKNSRDGLTLRLSQIDFQYKGRDVLLKNASLQAAPNELIAIIGPSGEGKTSLINIMLGLLKPCQGEAIIISKSGLEVTISAATRRFFSYVPQGNQIFSGTIADNLRLAKQEAEEAELIRALEAACAYEFVKELPEGINTQLLEGGGGLSEGQAQRISIARALLRKAPILLLDEATSALDPETEKRVLQGIIHFNQNSSCILTTHRNSVWAMCDRIYHVNASNMIQIINEEYLEQVVNI